MKNEHYLLNWWVCFMNNCSLCCMSYFQMCRSGPHAQTDVPTYAPHTLFWKGAQLMFFYDQYVDCFKSHTERSDFSPMQTTGSLHIPEGFCAWDTKLKC